MGTETGRTRQIAVRLELDLLTRLDAIAEAISRPGMPASRSDVIRMVVLAGLPILEEQEGLKKGKGK